MLEATDQLCQASTILSLGTIVAAARALCINGVASAAALSTVRRVSVVFAILSSFTTVRQTACYALSSMSSHG